MERWLNRIWQTRNGVSQSLRPLSWLFCGVVFGRRLLYRLRLLPSAKLPVPVIVVGNLTVGGTGKTPLVVAVAELLQAAGYRPGIISRGYRGKARSWPQQVRPDSDPVMVGDEPILIARRTGCPMAVGPKRVEDAHSLLKYADCDVIISDDGLQHYALRRDVEIVIIDGQRRFGNGLCLPAGPLREPVRRCESVDFILVNGAPAGPNEIAMQYEGETLINMADPQRKLPLAELRGQDVHAVAAIGNPQRFFERLAAAGLQVREHVFPDHHLFRKRELDYGPTVPIIMTEKDAVKCQRFAQPNMWYLPVSAKLDKNFAHQLLNRIKTHGQKSA